mgnify:CR=1 FL=1
MENEEVFGVYYLEYFYYWRKNDMNVGDKVKMNGKYYVSPINREKIFTIAAEPKMIFGKLYVWLHGCRGCYAMGGLDLVR